MYSPLDPVLVGMIICEVEAEKVPTLGDAILNWKRFVDDKVGYVKNVSIDSFNKTE